MRLRDLSFVHSFPRLVRRRPMSRLISCFTNSYGRFGPQACFEHVASAGLGHVELAVKTEGVPSIFKEEPILTDQSGPEDVEGVLTQLEQQEIKLSSCNISSGNPLDPEVLSATQRKLKIAGALGVPLVVAGAGEAEDPQQHAVLLDHLRRIGDAAGEEGIIYCFETHPGICRNAEGMLESMQQLDHPHLRLNFDTGNVLFYNAGADVLAQLRLVAEWVQHVHLKDHNGRPEDWHFPALGAAGAVDFTTVREILDEVGFSGPYSLEIEGIQDEPPLSLEGHHQRVVDSVNHLRACGYV